MSRRNLYWLLGIMAVSLLGLTVTYSAPTRESDNKYKRMNLLVDVLERVQRDYVTDVNLDNLVEDMINGGLERLDPHSQFINAREFKQFNKQSKGKFGGIGVQVGYDRARGNNLVVISPMPGTPAYEAGILAGDLIVKIDGKSTENMRLNEAVDLITGDPGQPITLTVVHEGAKDEIDVPITRAEIRVHSVMGDQRKAENALSWDYLIDKDKKIAYVRLTNFSETAVEELKAALEQIRLEGGKGLILDLRNNPGGLLSAAVRISNLFIREGLIVRTHGRNHKEEVHEAKPENCLPWATEHFPMVVLVNKYSASASEIVAAALQDHGRAVVFGERTYGKGSVQNIIMMEKETSALKLTTASFWRPNGKNIHRFPDSKEADDWGVKPNKDCEIPMKDEERLEYMLYRSERDIVRKNPRTNDKPGDKDKKPFVDRVLQKALEHLQKEIANGPNILDLLDRKDA